MFISHISAVPTPSSLPFSDIGATVQAYLVLTLTCAVLVAIITSITGYFFATRLAGEVLYRQAYTPLPSLRRRPFGADQRYITPIVVSGSGLTGFLFGLAIPIQMSTMSPQPNIALLLGGIVITCTTWTTVAVGTVGLLKGS